MAQRRVLVQLDGELLALIDERAARLRQSRSAVIRGAIERELRDERKKAIDKAIDEGYRRMPPDEFDAWADASAKRSIAAEPW